MRTTQKTIGVLIGKSRAYENVTSSQNMLT